MHIIIVNMPSTMQTIVVMHIIVMLQIDAYSYYCHGACYADYCCYAYYWYDAY